MQISESINHEQLGEIVNEMAIDKVVDLFAQLPSRKVHSFYPHMPVERVAEIHHLLGHSEHAAGSIMTTAFICARHDETSGMLLDRIKQGARKKLFIYYIYVLGDDDSLAGIVTLFQILAAPAGTRMSELMRKRVTRVTVDTNIKEVAEVFYKYDFVAVPVVDDRNRIQGIIPMKAAFGAVFRKIRDESLEAQR